MKNIIVAWCRTNEKDFENFVPLRFVGKRNKKLGFSNDFNVLFLEGYDLLGQAYKNELKELGYILHDVSCLYSEVKKKYSQLDRFGDYEKKCFLRWLVIDKVFLGEEIIHYDGDIVFNENPEIIAKKIRGKTFVLQGCPAFTSIANQEWFEQYKKELDLFVKNVEKYSKAAWQERKGWEVTFKTRWAGSRFREIISSDQDFLSHLIHTGRIIQDSVEDVSLCLQDYIFFENPLFIHMYDDNFSYKYYRKNDIDYFLCKREDAQDCFYHKRVLFWHMQSCFNFYLAKFILRKSFLKLPLGRLELHLQARGFEDYINKKYNRFFGHTARLNVYRYFFKKSDFSGIFKDKTWWKKGIFF